MADSTRDNYSLIVVDDEKPIRDGLEKFHWDRLGFECAGVAANAAQALALAERVRPDVVLSDIKMPGVSGIELAAALRTILPMTKVLLISGHRDFELARQAIHEAVYDYILKPIDQKQLEQIFIRLRTQLDNAQTQQDTVNSGRDDDETRHGQNPVVIRDFQVPAALAIHKAMRFLEDNFAHSFTMEEVAKMVGLSPAYFSERFKQIAGMNYIDYLTMTRMERAKQLLRDPKYKVQDVASRVGYIDPKYFTSAFKKFSGKTPLEFRRSLLGDSV